jgi:hypothetical protein
VAETRTRTRRSPCGWVARSCSSARPAAGLLTSSARRNREVAVRFPTLGRCRSPRRERGAPRGVLMLLRRRRSRS